MRRLLVLLFALSLCCALSACQPQAETSPPVSDTPLPTAPEPSEGVPTQPPVPDNARFFFAQGFFLGSWEDGKWYPANEGGFTVGQLFNRAYVNIWDETVEAVRFHIAGGPGAFSDPERAQRLLRPFGVVEGEDFVMALPGALSGDAAELSVSEYGFFAMFDGQTYQLISNVPLALPALSQADDFDSERVTQLLRGAEISFDLDRVESSVWDVDIDSDGISERLELIRNQTVDGGWLLVEEGDDIFYALFLTDDGETSVITEQVIDYIDDPVCHFVPGYPIPADLDGDGDLEIILQHGAWEWGHYSAFALENGQWAEVLRGDYGM